MLPGLRIACRALEGREGGVARAERGDHARVEGRPTLGRLLRFKSMRDAEEYVRGGGALLDLFYDGDDPDAAFNSDT